MFVVHSCAQECQDKHSERDCLLLKTLLFLTDCVGHLPVAVLRGHPTDWLVDAVTLRPAATDAQTAANERLTDAA
eukprot:6171836-Pleurochrysis_carterae.AAC.2